MERAFKSLKTSFKTREATIKDSITKQLSDTIKELQLGIVNDSEELNAENSICSVIEAMFLHGLKDTIAHRVRKVLADVDQRPEPSFWSPILVISHREIIEMIDALKHINTEVGQCRAWIRLALNDGLLSSYLMAMQHDHAAPKPYYHTYAYLRDVEMVEVAQRLIYGVETCVTFKLPCNSSLLNTWAIPSLILAGVWSPTLKTCPVAECLDVAQAITSSSNTIDPERSSFASHFSNNSYHSQTTLNEEEALRIILAKRPTDISNNIPDKNINEQPQTKIDETTINPVEKTKSKENEIPENTKQENLHAVLTPAPSETELQPNIRKELESMTENSSLMRCRSLEHSYNDLVQNYNQSEQLMHHIGTPEFFQTDMNLGKYLDKITVRERVTGGESSKENDDEVILNSGTNNKTNEDHKEHHQDIYQLQWCRMAREFGLDRQKYTCHGCAQPLTRLGDGSASRICAYTGHYFCTDCMADKRSVIPARIIHNWDFKEYEVSMPAWHYIEECREKPTLDLKLINPLIYTVVEEMTELKILRTQLYFLRAYLYTCGCVSTVTENDDSDTRNVSGVDHEILGQLSSRRPHFLDHVNVYSLADLLDVQTGHLVPLLAKIVQISREHVLSCTLCSQKGFLCEICRGNKPLYPFDIDSVYRCDNCSNVFHKNCLDASKPCPKCIRLKKLGGTYTPIEIIE